MEREGRREEEEEKNGYGGTHNTHISFPMI